MDTGGMSVIAEVGNGTDYTGELFVLGGIALAGVLGLIGNAIAKRMREPTRIETLWERLDSQDVSIAAMRTEISGLHDSHVKANRRNAAQGRIIRDLARQWTGPAPRLSPEDLDEVDEQTLEMDHHWRQKPQSEKEKK